jgi:hypothetical protein
MSLLWKIALAVLALLGLATLPSYAQTLDLTLAGGVLGSHAGDWASTEECLRRPYAQCHEAQLPNALVHNKVGFAAYELSTASLEVLAQYELTKHGHRKLARLAQSLNVGYTTEVVIHNYSLAGHEEQFTAGFDWRQPPNQY